MTEDRHTQKDGALITETTHSPPPCPDLSFVIVSWNVANLLADCIESIVAYSSALSYEIIVVDNASTDHTLQMLHDRYPWVRVIANSVNVGFARANNQAIRQATGTYFFILNPDTVLVEGALKTLTNALRQHIDVGMVGPCLYLPDGSAQHSCARLLPSLPSCLFCDILRLHKLPGVGLWFSRRYMYPYDYHREQEVEAISGAAMLVHRTLIQTIGGFGETYIHCGEDVELCLLIRKAGWKIRYLPDAHVIHFSEQSSRQAVARVEVNVALSRQQYFLRCYSSLHGLLYRLLVQGLQMPALILIGTLKLMSHGETISDFRIRLTIARGLCAWRKVD